MREKATRVKTIYLVCSYEIATMTYVDKQSVQKIRILEQFSASATHLPFGHDALFSLALSGIKHLHALHTLNLVY